MKICYLAGSLVPSRSANSIHVMRMCSAFASLGHQVTLIVPRTVRVGGIPDKDTFEFYGVPMNFAIVRLPKTRGEWGESIFAWLAAQAARRERADLIHTRWVRSGYSTALSGWDVNFEIHRPMIDLAPKRRMIFERLIELPAFGHLVVVSEALRQHYADQYPSLAGKIIVAHDGANAIADDQETMSLGKGRPNGLQVGYVGHLYQGRGIELIVELASMCPWADFHVVGGTDADLADWRARTKDQENLIWHGFMQPARTEAFRQGCDVLLAPYQTRVTLHGSRGDTARWMSPLKIFEYMAAGKAIIASDLPVLREVLHEGQNALLCPPDSVACWVEALTRLREQTSLRHELGRRAQEQFLQNHTWVSRAEYLVRGLRRTPASRGATVGAGALERIT